MGKYFYISPGNVLPSQDFLKEGTIRMIADALAEGQINRVPAPPIVRNVAFSDSFVAIDGHNLLATKFLLGENCLVYLAEDSRDFLQTNGNDPSVAQRNNDLSEKFDISALEAKRILSRGLHGISALLEKYHETAEYVRKTLLTKCVFIQERQLSGLGKAFVHGRFQPFHNQHLEYILAAKKLCEFLFIGITRCDPNQNSLCEVSPHRSESSANLLTYFERTEMISRCLLSEGLGKDQFGFAPIPIDSPRSLSYFMGLDVQCFTTICDEWNLHKIQVLESLGYKVKSLVDRRDGAHKAARISGSVIRDLIANGDDTWVNFVPRVVAQYLIEIQYPARLEKSNSMFL